MALSDFDLRNYIRNKRLQIEPFSDESIRENGLDLRLYDEIVPLKRTKKVFDLKNFDSSDFFERPIKFNSYVLKPNRIYLVATKEYLKIPPDLMGFINLRSTYARLGITIPPTLIDAGWEGQLTIRMECGDYPVRIYAGERFLHVIFVKLLNSVSRSYKGVYQYQRGIVLPKAKSTLEGQRSKDLEK